MYIARAGNTYSVLHKHLVQLVLAVSSCHPSHVFCFANRSDASDTIPRVSSRTSFDRYGKSYNVTAITNLDASLNVAKYEAYSPLFLSTTFAMSYGLSFASITSIITHTLLYFRKQIWVQSRRAMHEQPDIHARLMSRYPQVPEWWYFIILGLCPGP